uniref:OSJNBa0095H06.7 protein n=1 Tax=Oryza sativa subsp. japonica TaxID=39947 RepID=Q7XS11_ORYSJ|nr:OSJNBa0095H06.7 [Oryza sativa Japonica Group]
MLAARALHAKCVPRLLLKVDIAKAFDMVSWPFLLEVLAQLGFSQRWRDWVSLILSASSSRVLVNGVPGWVIKAIDKKRHPFLWTGTDSANGGQCRVSWTKVCHPRYLSGMGIPDLRIAGFALRVRWLWLQRSGHPNWSDLKASVERSVSDMFAASTFTTLGDASIAPDLLHVVPPRFRGSRTVATGLANNSWVGDIRGALTVPVISQFLLVWDAVLPTQLSPGVEDRLVWCWTGDQCYSVRLAYQAFFLG